MLAPAVGRSAAIVHPTAVVDAGAELGLGVRVWHFSYVRAGAVVGEDTMLAQNVYVGAGVRVGRGCRIQNNVSLYEGVVLEDAVFCGPSCVFTNVQRPRAEYPWRAEDPERPFFTTHVAHGATLGANATIVCGVRIGRYAFVAAGAVVTHDVPDFALVMGQPARQVAWVGRRGERLEEISPGTWRCPRTDELYVMQDAALVPLS